MAEIDEIPEASELFKKIEIVFFHGKREKICPLILLFFIF
jgi:hypothetical protein